MKTLYKYGKHPWNEYWMTDHVKGNPVLLIVIGGGWTDGDFTNGNLKGVERLADQGITVAAMRYSTGNVYPIPVHEVRACLWAVRKRTNGKITLLGASAGGHIGYESTALYNGWRSLWKWLPMFKAADKFIGLYGAYYNSERFFKPDIWDRLKVYYRGRVGKSPGDMYRAMNKTPTMFIHGRDDTLVFLSHSLVLARRMGVLLHQYDGEHGKPIIDFEKEIVDFIRA